MPAYIKKTSSFDIYAQGNLDYVEDFVGQVPSSKYTEEHLKFSENLFTKLSDLIGNNEGQAFNKAETLGVYLYIDSLVRNDERDSIIMTVVEFFPDQAALDAAEAWLREERLFNNHMAQGNSVITYENVDFHKPYKN